MITLPTAVATTSASSKTGAAATTPDSTLDATPGGDSAASGENLPQGFLTLLGNRLLSLAQQGASAAPQDDTAQNVTADGKAPAKTSISDLLAALDKPETLTALLQPQKASTEKSPDSEEKAAPVELSSSDLQALQALYAMLPNAAAVPVASGNSSSKNSDLLSSDLSKSSKGSTLNALSAALGKMSSDDADAAGTATTKTGSAGVLLPGNSDSATAAAKSSTNPGAQTLDSAFQQVMNHVSKDNDKENSSSALNATITNNVISAASSAQTPTSTSTVSAPATPLLNSQLGSPEWQQALGQQILMFSRNGQQTAELHLHPQDLGSIQISLKLDNDQAQLSMVSNHSQVRATLEAAIPQLRTSLAESGISLGQSNVSSDAFQQGQSFNGQQEQQRNNNGNPFSLANENDSDVTQIAVPAALQARAAGSNAVDIFA